jgi:hypothetical protein
LPRLGGLLGILLWGSLVSGTALAQVELQHRQVLPTPLKLSPALLQGLLETQASQIGAGQPGAATLQLQPSLLQGWLLESADRLNLQPVELSGANVALPQGTLLSYSHNKPLMDVATDGARLLRLPFELHAVAASNSVPSLGTPEILPERNSLRWSPEKGRFSLRLRLVLRSEGAGRNLPNPITFLLRSNAQSVEPAQLVARRSNEALEFELADPGLIDQATLGVEVLGLVGVRSTPVAEFSLERPTLAISVSPERLPGLGLGQAELQIEAQGLTFPGGVALSGSNRPSPLRLRAAAMRGRLTPGELQLDSKGLARATLRSVGLGAETLRLEGLPFANREVALHYHFPWLFLLAALLGGLAGGVAAVRLQRRPGLSARDLAFGSITGLLAAVAYTSGINLLGIDLGSGTHEALIFTLSALTALVGLPGLQKLLPAPKAP